MRDFKDNLSRSGRPCVWNYWIKVSQIDFLKIFLHRCNLFRQQLKVSDSSDFDELLYKRSSWVHFSMVEKSKKIHHDTSEEESSHKGHSINMK